MTMKNSKVAIFPKFLPYFHYSNLPKIAGILPEFAEILCTKSEEKQVEKRVGNRERGLQSQQRETKKERDAWGSFSKDEVSEG